MKVEKNLDFHTNLAVERTWLDLKVLISLIKDDIEVLGKREKEAYLELKELAAEKEELRQREARQEGALLLDTDRPVVPSAASSGAG